MTYKVLFTKSFNDDLDEAVGYISEILNNRDAAKKLLNKVSDIISILEDNPLIFPLYYEKEIAKEELRYAVIAHYLLFYRVDEKKRTVFLNRFLYGRQNIADLF